MRVRCDPLSSTGTAVPVIGDDGSRCALVHARCAWTCRGTPLDLRVLAEEPVELPEAEPSEPVVGALARIAQALAGSGAVALLANPAAALGAERMALAEGVRALAVAEPADEACWDATLALGLPLVGIRGTVCAEVERMQPRAVLDAIRYGLCTCEEGLSLARLEEDRAGVRWSVAGGTDPVTATVVVRGGFEAARLAGRDGAWTDAGSEGSVRVVATDAAGRRVSSQPRFVAPRRAHG